MQSFKNSRLNELKASVVKVLDDQGWITGTGFLISPQFILTTGKQPRPFKIVLETGVICNVGEDRNSIFLFNKILNLTLASVDGLRNFAYLPVRATQNTEQEVVVMYYSKIDSSL
jgi:hypothetical protein